MQVRAEHQDGVPTEAAHHFDRSIQSLQPTLDHRALHVRRNLHKKQPTLPGGLRLKEPHGQVCTPSGARDNINANVEGPERLQWLQHVRPHAVESGLLWADGNICCAARSLWADPATAVAATARVVPECFTLQDHCQARCINPHARGSRAKACRGCL
eukprot:686057-Prymnesium_polylepis.1